ncbi:hypothetical protein AAC387_Pa05g1385 [Persea americana]
MAGGETPEMRSVSNVWPRSPTCDGRDQDRPHDNPASPDPATLTKWSKQRPTWAFPYARYPRKKPCKGRFSYSSRLKTGNGSSQSFRRTLRSFLSSNRVFNTVRAPREQHV